MRTSRISRETARIVSRGSNIRSSFSRPQTRSLAATLQVFTAVASSGQDVTAAQPENFSEDESSLSSISSTNILDIEDIATSQFPTQKRKRQLDLTTDATPPNIRASPRKSSHHAKNESNHKPKKLRRQPAKKIVNEAGEVKIHPPAKWEEVYGAVKEMRKSVLAPVDTMGCETLADERLSPRDKRFQTLIALMLSSQTKDTTNAIAMRRLQTELPAPGLTLETILDVDPVRLNELIYVVGFHNNKTRYIKATALILRDNFASDIPDTVEGLMSLPGVGPKMAYLCLSAAWGRTEGIGVDVHVHRITNLWRWHTTKTPEETRLILQAWLPRDKWHEINHLLVGFGQTICLPVGKDCQVCTLSAKGLCPSAIMSRSKANKRMKKEEVTQEFEKHADHIKSEELLVFKEEEAMQESGKSADVTKSEQDLALKPAELSSAMLG